MPNNNDIINRPFKDLEERLADADRMERLDNTEQKGVDYRAIANFLSGEIYHLVNTTSDPKVKEWGLQLIRKFSAQHTNLLDDLLNR